MTDYSMEHVNRLLAEAEAEIEGGNGFVPADSPEARGDDEIKLTDLGNARRLVILHGEDLLYCHQWREWLVWDGRRFALDVTGEAQRRAKTVSRQLWQQCADDNFFSSDERQEIAEWAHASEKVDRIRAMLKLAESEPSIPITPEKLDGDPWKLNCLDGVIALKTGELLPHDRSYHCTKLCATEYGDSGAECPLWEQFLERIFDGNVAVIRFMQRLLGYSLAGRVYEHCLPVFYGTGANGKSVLIETMLGVLGADYACKGVSDLLLAKRNESHPTERADLFGKRFVACVETEDGRRLAEGMVKELTGGDTIKARRMRENFWEFRPSHLAVLVTNHKPRVTGTDNSIWRRLRLVLFGVTIPTEEQDKQLAEKLLAERSGILRWLVNGCLAWQRDGLAEPPEVMAATERYKTEMDTLGQFVDECCVEGEHNQVKASDLYEVYSSWAKQHGEYVQSARRFGSAIGERYERYKNNGTWYRGITITQSTGF